MRTAREDCAAMRSPGGWRIASAAIMRGDPEPMREMLDAIVREGT
jgi:hypothetical protein